VWLWTETNRWIIEFTSTLPDERRKLIHAEDIFSKQRKAVRDVFEFVASPPPDDRRIDRILEKRLNQQKVGTFPKPIDWTDSMREDLSRVAGNIAGDLGYDIAHPPEHDSVT
jgi:hypothetical protein